MKAAGTYLLSRSAINWLRQLRGRLKSPRYAIALWGSSR